MLVLSLHGHHKWTTGTKQRLSSVSLLQKTNAKQKTKQTRKIGNKRTIWKLERQSFRKTSLKQNADTRMCERVEYEMITKTHTQSRTAHTHCKRQQQRWEDDKYVQQGQLRWFLNRCDMIELAILSYRSTAESSAGWVLSLTRLFLYSPGSNALALRFFFFLIHKWSEA